MRQIHFTVRCICLQGFKCSCTSAMTRGILWYHDGPPPTNGSGNGLLGSGEAARMAALGAGRRKMSSPATFLGPQRPIARRLSNVGIQARKFSHGLVFGSGPATAEIVCQGRALCAQYIRSRLKRNGLFTKKCGLQRLRSAATLPGGYVVRQVLPDLISVGTELERLHPKVYFLFILENMADSFSRQLRK
uniref:Bcl-2-related ovarian killer protein n=1 Tax=Lygus hesperus TaxID=30085 RepID=A0A0A9YQE7_LYGHE